MADSQEPIGSEVSLESSYDPDLMVQREPMEEMQKSLDWRVVTNVYKRKKMIDYVVPIYDFHCVTNDLTGPSML